MSFRDQLTTPRRMLFAFAVLLIIAIVIAVSGRSGAMQVALTEQPAPGPSSPASPSADAAKDTDTDTAVAVKPTDAVAAETPAVVVNTPQKPPGPPPLEHYQIKDGDTLSQIFSDRDISATLLYRLLEADVEFLSLETLHPGTQLTFRYDEEHRLQQLALQIDPARQVTFDRLDDGAFVHHDIESDTHWVSTLVPGEVQGSFYVSGLKAGLSKRQVVEISHLLKNRLNFRRSLRAGDRFSVLVGREMTGEMPTGNSQVDAVALHRGATTYQAFLAEDGSYYDENGDSIAPAFLRWPTSRHFRVSSSFDRNRLHPITGRKSPHNGVDLATPMGTVVMSTGDGTVTRVGNHPYAGRYVDIKHSGSFETRYLHLSKVLVKRGQRVKRGQKIALSGNTGRTTGPHLHFEFHAKGNPVNPLTADIPTSTRIAKDQLNDFKAQVKRQLARMATPVKPDAIYAEGPSQPQQ
ncbi:peptidoglycan DD-metalloendopeptidase family protein [Marinobacter antarcticus]|nr:peptidoglycan DD-metalloendopeptidase family protein [Marinobacter antarcticus]